METRQRTYAALDESPQTQGDEGFLGVNMRLHPARVSSGYASNAVNKRFVDGTALTRKAIAKLGWSNRLILPDRTTIYPFDKVWGTGEYRDSAGRDWLIIAADGFVYKCKEWNSATKIPLPAGVVIEEPVRFVQAMKRPQEALLMLRGTASSPKQMLVMENLGGGFGMPAMTTPVAPLINAPNTHQALYLQNRVNYIQGRDIIFTSDLLDYTVGSVVDDMSINRGEGGQLTALVKFTETSFIAAKDKAIHRITNFYGDLSDVRGDLITGEYGCKAPDSFAMCGSDVWFLADRRGVVSIQQTDFDKIKALDVPISRDIQPLIDRINWRLAHLSFAAYHDNKYYLAVPLDSGEEVRAEITDHITGIQYDSFSNFALTVKKGRDYRVSPGFYEASLVNGTETKLFTPFPNPGGVKPTLDFTAQGTSITLTSSVSSAAVSAQVRPVFKGPNAVLVYDFMNRSWSGYDAVSVVPEFVWAETGIDLTPRTFRWLTESGDLFVTEDGLHHFRL